MLLSMSMVRIIVQVQTETGRPGAHEQRAVTRLSWRTPRPGEASQPGAGRGGARTPSNSCGVAPDQNTATSSMQSPPANAASTTVSVGARVRRPRPGQPDVLIDQLSHAQALRQQPGHRQAAVRQQAVVVKGRGHPREIVEQMPSRSGFRAVLDTHMVPGERAFVVEATQLPPAGRWWVRAYISAARPYL